MRHFIDMIRENAADLPAILYHGTSTDNLLAIQETGIIEGPSHWGSRKVAEGFAHQKVRDTGTGKPVLIAIPLGSFSGWHLYPDENMIDFPVFDDADERAQAWMASREDWQASLAIYEAVLYDADLYWDEAQANVLTEV